MSDSGAHPPIFSSKRVALVEFHHHCRWWNSTSSQRICGAVHRCGLAACAVASHLHLLPHGVASLGAYAVDAHARAVRGGVFRAIDDDRGPCSAACRTRGMKRISG